MFGTHPNTARSCIPKNPAVRFISFDIYEKYHETGKWTNFASYFTPIKAFCDKRRADGFPIIWGLSETGLTEEVFDLKPTYFTDLIALMKQYDGRWYDYFNSGLNSSATWLMSAGDSREIALGKARKAN